jgi:hypothetical protein
VSQSKGTFLSEQFKENEDFEPFFRLGKTASETHDVLQTALAFQQFKIRGDYK